MRYLPHTQDEIQSMLQQIGVKDVDALFDSIPQDLKLNRPLKLPTPLSELELRNELRSISRQNAHGEDWSVFLGGGAYSHYIPSVVSQILLRGEFLTAYTPYQPEISQGTLQAIFEYQTLVCEILGLDVANASHYDGSTATAEAALMALNLTGRKKILVARNLHPEYREVLKTYVHSGLGEIEEIPFTDEGTLDRKILKAKLNDTVACVIAAVPNFFGIFEDVSEIASEVHQAGGLLITSTTEPLAFGLFKSPGEMGADIAVAEGQSFGNTISFGGPNLGLFAVKKEYVRAMPGRLVGETVDAAGQRGFVLTLATREQHIRRERASSNICTNVSLCALAATITLSLWGKKGFQDLAQMNFEKSAEVRHQLTKISGVQPRFSGTSFNEFVVKLPSAPERVIPSLLQSNVIPGIPLGTWYPELKDCLLVCVTEMNTEEQVRKLVNGLTATLLSSSPLTPESESNGQ